MRQATWPLQAATRHFAGLVEAARRSSQTVTIDNKPAVVVLAAEEYVRLQRIERAQAANFVDHLLAMPADDGRFERLIAPLCDAKM